MNKKKILCLILVLTVLTALVFTLAACGGKDDDDGGGDTFTPPTTETKLNADESFEILSAVTFPDEYIFEAGSMRYMYKKTGDDIILSRQSNGVETYYGKIDGKYYRIMVNNTSSTATRSYVELTKWEYDLAINSGLTELNSFSYKNLKEMLTVEKAETDMKLKGTDIDTSYSVSGVKYPVNENSYTYEIIVKTVTIDNIDDFYIPVNIELRFSINELGLLTNINQTSTKIEGYAPSNIISSENDSTNAVSSWYRYENPNVTLPSLPSQNFGSTTTVSLNPYNNVNFPDEFNRNVAVGSTVTLPAPKETGATFEGWYLDRNYTVPAGSSLTVGYSNVALYPKFSGNAPKLELDGGTLSESHKALVDNCGYYYLTDYRNLNINKVGYDFENFYLDSAFTRPLTSENTDVASSSVTLYAKYNPLIKVTLSIDSDYTLLTSLGTGGQSVNLPEQSKVIKKECFFDYWCTDSACTTPVTYETKYPNTDVTYYAKYSEAYAVTVNADNIIDAGFANYNIKYINIPKTPTLNYGLRELLLSLTSNFSYSTNDHKSIGGFYLDSGFSNELTEYPTSSITVYARALPTAHYTIDVGTGSLMNSFSEVIYYYKYLYSYNQNQLLEAIQTNITAPTNMQFDKWYKDNTLSVPYDASKWPEADTTLYAGYVEIPAIYFDLGIGESVNSNFISNVFDSSTQFPTQSIANLRDYHGTLKNYFDAIQANPYSATNSTCSIIDPAGKRFIGWFTDSDCLIPAVITADTPFPNVKTTYYAGYEDDVALTINLGNNTPSQVNAAITLSTVSINYFYRSACSSFAYYVSNQLVYDSISYDVTNGIFEGWFTNADCTEAYVPGATFQAATIYAKFSYVPIP